MGFYRKERFMYPNVSRQVAQEWANPDRWNTSTAYIESRVLCFERFLKISDTVASAGPKDRYRCIQELCSMAVQFGDACLNDLVRSVLLAYQQIQGPRVFVAKLHAMNEYCRNNRAYYQAQLSKHQQKVRRA